MSGDVTVSGNSKIEAVPLTECPTRVGLFGNPADTDDTNDQEVKVQGNSKINNAFVYFPDAKVGSMVEEMWLIVAIMVTAMEETFMALFGQKSGVIQVATKFELQCHLIWMYVLQATSQT